MSFLTIATPTIDLATAIRPLIGLGFLGTLALVFEPLLKGMLRASLLLFIPRRSLDEDKASADYLSLQELYHLARKHEDSEPSLAAELRAVAARA